MSAIGDNFYADLPAYDRFDAITDPGLFVRVPEDWHVAIADVVDSTTALRSGKYRQVNALGAASIVSMLNIDRSIELPFVFGGDGAVVLIPPGMSAAARHVVADTRKMASVRFGLDLRVGLVPVERVRSDGYDIRILKVRVSDQYDQAMFAGGGIAYCERLIKDPSTSGEFLIGEDGTSTESASYEGLECRWEDLPARGDETVTLLVRALRGEVDAPGVYRDALGQIETIYGKSEDTRPVGLDNLKIAGTSSPLQREAAIRARGGNLSVRWYAAVLWLRMLVFRYVYRYKHFDPKVSWDEYRRALVESTDHRKYDDMLRMVLTGSASQRERLTEWLAKAAKGGRLVYGMHVSDRAIMTCIVLDHAHQHVHFVDGAGGGYAMAALDMKRSVGGAAMSSSLGSE